MARRLARYRFPLIWLGCALAVAADWALALALPGGTPNALDGLLFLGVGALASLGLAPAAARLARSWYVRWAAALLLAAALACLLPWLLVPNLGRMPAGAARDFFELPFRIKPLIIALLVEPYRDGLPVAALARASGLLALLGLALATLALCARVAWDALARPIGGARPARDFVLVWLSAAYLAGLNGFVAVIAGGTANLRDTLVFGVWAALAARWLARPAAWLARRWPGRALALGLPALLLAWLFPWMTQPYLTGVFASGPLSPLFELPYHLRPAILAAYYAVAPAPAPVLLLVLGLCLGFGVALAALATCGRVAWDMLTASAERRYLARRFVLVWLAGALVTVWLVALGNALHISSFWPYLVVALSWLALAGAWLDPLAAALERRRVLRFFALLPLVLFVIWLGNSAQWQFAGILLGGLALATLLLGPLPAWAERRMAMPWGMLAALLLGLIAALVASFAGTVAIDTTLLAVLAYELGFGLLALSWRLLWRRLRLLRPVAALEAGYRRGLAWLAPLLARGWGRAFPPLHRRWTNLNRLSIWRLLLRGLALLLALLLLANGAGIALALRPPEADWSLTPAAGLPTDGPLSVYDLATAADGRLMLATTTNGIYRSDDGGESWAASNTGLDFPNPDVLLLLGDGRRAVVGTNGGGMYRTEDAGASWQHVVLPEGTLFINRLVGAADGSKLFARTSAGLYRSDDAGRAWRLVEGSPDSKRNTIMAITADGRQLFSGDDLGLYRSDDDGLTWRALGQDQGIQLVGRLALADNGQQMVVDTQAGLFYSADGGQSWRRIKPDPDESITQVVALTPDGRHIFVANYNRVYRSDDGGQSWQAGALPKSAVGINQLRPDRDGRRVFAITYADGLYRSDDGGATWQRSRRTPASLPINTLALAAGARRMFATTYGGVYRSDDGGQSWLLAAGPTVDGFGQPIYSYSLSAAADGAQLFSIATGRVYRSDDAGVRWQLVNQPSQDGRLATVMVTPDRRRVFASDEQSKVYRSDNAGTSWQPIAELEGVYINRFFAVPPDGKLVFAASYRGLYRSGDGGATWQKLGGLPDSGIYNVVATPDGRQLLVGSYNGVYRSGDGGATWQLSEQFVADQLPLALSADGQRMFVGTNSGVYRSGDGGATWQNVSAGLGNRYVRELVLAPDNTLLAGTLDGLYRSGDGGATWQNAGQGLMARSVSLSPDATGRSLTLLMQDGDWFQLGDDMRWSRLAEPQRLQQNGYVLSGDTIELLDSEYGRVPLARVQGVPPRALIVRDGVANLYAPGSAVALRTISLPLPQLVRPQGAYWSMVAWSWRRLLWLRTNAGLLAVGPGLLLALALAYAYAGIARPNRLRARTFGWLLRHPRYLLAAAGYRAYAERAAAAEPLEQLVLLHAPLEGPLALAQIDAALRELGAASSPAALQSACPALAQRGLLLRDEAGWRVADPMLAEVHRRELAPGAPAQLAERTRQSHPLFAEARRFLEQAGFAVAPADAFGLLATSSLPLWADVSPLYVRMVLDRELDLAEFGALCAAARTTGGELRGRTAAVVIDQPPRAGDLYQIFALRAQEGLTIVPLPSSLIGQARLASREIEALKEQIDLYAGRTDLYDMRAAVTDVLSFFGRSSLLADLQRRLIGGRSVAVFGVRKIGKSSLMGRLREECGWPVATINIEEYVGGFGYLYAEALSGWRAAIEASAPDLALPALPAELAAADAAAQAQAFRQAVGELLALLASQPRRPGLLLFVDEIDILFGQPAYADFAAVLRGLAENPRWRGRFAVLVAGLDPLLNRADRMDGQRNPFYSFFGELPLPPLEPADARTMIMSLGGQMGVSYDDAAIDMLAEAGGGHPFLTRQICSQAVRDLDRPAVVSAERAAQAIEAYLRLPRNYMAESLWGMDNGGPPAPEAELLRLLAAAPQPDAALLAAELPPEARRARQLALDRLCDQSLVRSGSLGWELSIPLYRRWIERYVLALPAA
ncbi:WD40/YVTN/BNR-like repeat-containing protein [Kouleothrix sp.]|uniref:WD40/YVTN/BNR-like repeat-containing protein n=1 Tax=Kouleothrix sp. TaxID=2779161 RepID=UPI003919A70D